MHELIKHLNQLRQTVTVIFRSTDAAVPIYQNLLKSIKASQGRNLWSLLPVCAI